MAIWQFGLNLLPRKGIIEKFKVLPECLNEYKANFNNENDVATEPYDNYWEGSDIEPLALKYRQLLPTIKSWDKDLNVYGYENGSKVEVWEDDIYIKFDARTPNYSVLKDIVKIGKSFDCIFVIEENGHIVEPDFELILECFQNSRAYRFCKSPDEVLCEATKLKDG